MGPRLDFCLKENVCFEIMRVPGTDLMLYWSRMCSALAVICILLTS